MLSDEMRKFYHESVAKSKSKDTDDPRELVAASAGFVGYAIDRRFLNDDNLQDGLAHLCYAATMFDPSKAKWSTYATKVSQRYRWGQRNQRRIKAEQFPDTLKKNASNTVVCHRTKEPSEHAFDGEMKEKIASMLRMLPSDLRLVISLRFGFDGNRPHNRNEIAAITRVTPEWVRRQETKAIEKMRAMMAESALIALASSR